MQAHLVGCRPRGRDYGRDQASIAESKRQRPLNDSAPSEKAHKVSRRRPMFHVKRPTLPFGRRNWSLPSPPNMHRQAGALPRLSEGERDPRWQAVKRMNFAAGRLQICACFTPARAAFELTGFGTPRRSQTAGNPPRRRSGSVANNPDAECSTTLRGEFGGGQRSVFHVKHHRALVHIGVFRPSGRAYARHVRRQ